MTENPVFLKSLKPLAMEEFLDFYFYRRVAIRLVPWLHRLGLSPNQVTTLSMFTGLGAAYAVLRHRFVLAAAVGVAAIVLDCCDGQLARLSGKSSPLGRAMDGTFDLVWVASLWLAIFFSGFLQASGFPRIFWLMFFSAASMIVHCWRFDARKVQTLEISGAAFSEGDLDFDAAKRLLGVELRRFNPLTVILVLCMMFQMYFFVRGKEKKRVHERSEAEKRRIGEIMDPVLSRWSWLGEGHHNTLVILGVAFLPMSPYVLVAAFWTILLPMNLWWVACEVQSVRALRRIED